MVGEGMRFIKLSDKIVDWEWFTDGNMLKVWIYLLVNAQQFSDTRYRGVDLKTGQLITGRKQISRDTGLSEMQVRTCLNKLKSTNEITIEATNHYSLITIVKYGLYQSRDSYGNQQLNQELNQPITNGYPTDNQQITTSKRDKRDKRDRGKDIHNTDVLFAPHDESHEAEYQLHLVSDQYQPVYREDIEYLQNLYPAVNVEQEIRNMVGWCEANPQNRKTPKGIRKFINSWLAKRQDRSGSIPDALKEEAQRAYIEDVRMKKEKKEGGFFYDAH